MNGLHIDAATRQFLSGFEASGAPPLHTMTPGQARAAFAEMQAIPVSLRPASMTRYTLADAPFRLVIPATAPAAPPVIVYLHGGAWMLGGFGTHERLVRELAHRTGAAVAFVEYDRSPEARYPVAVEQAYAVTRFLAEKGKAFGVDGSRVAVAGDSAGGTLAAAVTLLARERGGPELRFQVLFCPITNANFDTGSYREFAAGPLLTRETMEWFWDAYAPGRSVRREPLAAPLRAPEELLHGLPPAFIATSEYDLVRDEGEAYARKLADAGVPVTAARYGGTIHDFMMLNALAETPAASAAIAQASHLLRGALRA